MSNPLFPTCALALLYQGHNSDVLLVIYSHSCVVNTYILIGVTWSKNTPAPTWVFKTFEFSTSSRFVVFRIVHQDLVIVTTPLWENWGAFGYFCFRTTGITTSSLIKTKRRSVGSGGLTYSASAAPGHKIEMSIVFSSMSFLTTVSFNYKKL